MNNDLIRWIIPLIALVVWILANLAKGQPEKDQQNRPRPTPPDDPNRPAGQRPQQADLDRFLRELERKRKQEEQAAPELIPTVRPAPPPRPTQPPARPAPRPAAQAPPPRPQPARTPPGRTPAGRPATPPPIPTRQPPPPVPAGEPIVVAAEVEVGPVADLKESAVAYEIQKKRARPHGSAVANTVIQMLNDPNTVRAAFILREVLDHPVAHRRRR